MPAWITPLLAPVCPPPTAGPALEHDRVERRAGAASARAPPPARGCRRRRRPGRTPPARPPSQPACFWGTPLASSSRSESTISLTISSKLVRGSQPSFSRALRRVADQVLDLGRAQEARVDAHVLLGVEPDVREGDVDELAHRVRLAGGDHVVVGLVLLEHQPHRLDVVLGVAPVALGVEVAERAARPGSPSLMAAAAWVTLRVTNSSPRRSLSWLKRIPEQANRS